MIDIKTITKMEIDCFKFLEELRQSGITNMYGAVPYIEDWFKDNGHYIGTPDSILTDEAQYLLSEWMRLYNTLVEEGLLA